MCQCALQFSLSALQRFMWLNRQTGFYLQGRLYFVGFFLAESLRSAEHAGNFLSVTALSPRLREKGNVAYKAA
jgi:hypothetical protein